MMYKLLPRVLCLMAVIGVGPLSFRAVADPSAPAMLPDGFLHVRGSQIVGADGNPVRIASVGLTGMNIIGGHLELAGPFPGMDGHVAAMKAMGFNCVRVDWIDKTLVASLPVVLRDPTKLVYSVHEYPKEIGGYSGPEWGPGYIERMNKT